MKLLISPAKKMIENKAVGVKPVSKLLFNRESKTVLDRLQDMDVDHLSKLMKISQDLAQQNWERHQQIGKKGKQAMAALFAFNGEVYRGVNAKELDDEALNYCQNNLYILSGLYGLLRPLDPIQAYRLEMGTRLKVGDSNNLHSYWKPIITDYLDAELGKDELILNLASAEYSAAIDFKRLKRPVLSIDFMDMHQGQLKKIMVYFKQARGAMVNYCAKHGVETVEEIKQAEVLGYRMDESLSNDATLTFTR